MKIFNCICILLCATIFINCSTTTPIEFSDTFDESVFKVLKGKTDTLQNAYMLSRLNRQFDKRREWVDESLRTVESLDSRRKKLKQWYIDKVGELPPKSPLNSIVSGKIDMKGYTIEKVTFESQPNHHVTGLFYLPKKRNAPFPAVYIPCGHSYTGKGAETYQKAARLFALNGFAVLQADPVSQGERFQLLDEAGKPATGGGTKMHELLGEAQLLTGRSSLINELHDNIRGLDFLEAHPKVNKDKLAVAGNSGGGTQVVYMVGYDDRIKVATPSCYLATSEKKFNTIGSQDGCQQLWGEGAVGMDEQDFLLMAAGIPIRLLAAEQDFFSFDGVKTAYADLKRHYKKLGLEEKIDMVSTDATHGWSQPLREASVQWCKQWLMNDPSAVTEPKDIGWFENDSLIWASKTGQVLSSFEGEKSVIDLNKERLVTCAENRKAFLSGNSSEEVFAQIKKLIGFEAPASNQFEVIEEIKMEGYSVTKVLLKRTGDFGLPALLFKPDHVNSKNPAIIMANENGKNSDIQPGGLIEQALNRRQIVLSLDVSNTGELKDARKAQYDNDEFWIAKMAIYEGKTLMTYRAEELLMAAQFLETQPEVIKGNIEIIATGRIDAAALHAAVIHQNITKVTLIEPTTDWTKQAASYTSKNQVANLVPNVLNYYDLGDLPDLIPKTKVEIIKTPNQ
jgi:dienelactone hydrolase